MLFTRCPHCNTTFRITAEALTKANGQVRCGRCVNVFNARAQLREQSDEDGADVNGGKPKQAARGPTQHTPLESQGEAEAVASSLPTTGDAGPTDVDVVTPNDITQEHAADAPQNTRAEGQVSVEAAQTAEGPAGEEIVLRSESADATNQPSVLTTVWSPDADEETPPARAKLWRVAAIAGACLLLLQIMHHFRAEFAGQPVVGSLIQSTYAFFGAPVTPLWNVEQYQVVNWTAAADVAENGSDTLVIAARIQNRGPDAQPFPHIHVQLKDRWESAIGSRIFAPEEYIANHDDDALMSTGDTVQARLIVVDPGPDAYGFEIDVCVQQDAKQLRCASDQIFQ